MNQPTTPLLFDLTGKCAMVTGASGHLGKAIAYGLAEAGATLVVTSRTAETAEGVAKELPCDGGQQHVGVALDHLDPASIESAFAVAASAVGDIDILVNNAHQPTRQTWSDATAEGIAEQLANVTGYFLLARLVRDHAVERQSGASVILLGSMYGLVSSYPQVYEGLGPSNPVAYQVLKGGIVQLTRHLAVHWATDGVRVNTLSPGPFPDKLSLHPELEQRLTSRTPLQRLGSPHELKGAAVFLASDASSFVTGHNLVVDGGWTAW
jgi:NAD(P)-dependent dehydrogenase (short-subunit alcohol dehydrogenase family)